MQETGFNPWVMKILWRRKWQSTPVFLPEEFHRQRSLMGYSSWSCKESDMTERLTHTHLHYRFPRIITLKGHLSHLPLIFKEASKASVHFSSVSQSYLIFVTPWTAHAMVPCPSPAPRACLISYPYSRRCHPTISSSVVPFSSTQSFPVSAPFPVNQFFASCGQSIGV